MATYKISGGDIFASEHEALVCPVNCVGVMGKGLAAEFKHLYPAMFKEYAEKCRTRELSPGKGFLYMTMALRAPDPQWILCAPTKDHWRDKSNLEDVRLTLEWIAAMVRQWGIKSIAVPALGCGEGGLSWEQVKPLMDEILEPLELQDKLYPYKEIYKPGAGRGSYVDDFDKSVVARLAKEADDGRVSIDDILTEMRSYHMSAHYTLASARAVCFVLVKERPDEYEIIKGQSGEPDDMALVRKKESQSTEDSK